jgi:single-strand DNA-binding protein
MFDTVVTIVGNVLNAPELRRLPSSRAAVAKFKVAATSRRYDKEHGRWVDGASLRLRVNCWRRLAENVAASVLTGDPVVVTGRIYTRDWVGEDGQHRVSYEMDAVAVGHDLARGRSQFERNRASSTTMIDDNSDGPGAGGPGARGAGLPAGEAGETYRDAMVGLESGAAAEPAGCDERLGSGQREPAPIPA